MKKVLILAGMCLALLVPACKGQDEAIREKTAQTQEAPAPRPAPVTPAPIVAVTDSAIAAGVSRAMAANGDTNRSARTIQVGETRKDVCGLPTVTFKKGDDYWSLCEAALKDPVATELARVTAKRAELNGEIRSLSAELAAVQSKLAKAHTDLTAADSAAQHLQARITARPAAAPAPRALAATASPATAAPPATGQPQTKRS